MPPGIDELSRLRQRIAELEARIADEQRNQTSLARLVSLSGLRPALPRPLRHQQPALPKVPWSQVSIAVRNAGLPPVGAGPQNSASASEAWRNR
jgi:hypothetical protein